VSCVMIIGEKNKERKKEESMFAGCIHLARGHSHHSDLYAGSNVDLLPHTDSISSCQVFQLCLATWYVLQPLLVDSRCPRAWH
jgi:hypothetical protein